MTGIKYGDKRLMKLLDEVLIKLGMVKPTTSYHFEKLDNELEFGLTTLKRLWNYETYTKDFSIRTLNILAQKVGYKDWDDYIQKTTKVEDEFKKSVKQFYDAEIDLEIGTIITLGCESQNYIKLEYISLLTFKVLEYRGFGNIKEGDEIEARWFEVVDPNFKDYNNESFDIIGLFDELKSYSHQETWDMGKYVRLYLSK